MKCAFSQSLEQRTLTTEAWKAQHNAHLAGADFGREPFPHPSGTWYWLVCPCGAKHLTTE